MKHLLEYVPLTIVGVWACQAAWAMITGGYLAAFRMFGLDILSDTFHVGSGTLHASTALIGLSLCAIVYVLLRAKPIPVRMVVSAAIPVLGLLFYDFVHIVFDLLITGRGLPLIQLTLVAGAYLILHLYNVRYKFMQVTDTFIAAFTVFVVVLWLFVSSGFFQALYVYNTVGGPDPHGPLWLLTKFVTVWMWLGLLWHRGILYEAAA